MMMGVYYWVCHSVRNISKYSCETQRGIFIKDPVKILRRYVCLLKAKYVRVQQNLVTIFVFYWSNLILKMGKQNRYRMSVRKPLYDKNENKILVYMYN